MGCRHLHFIRRAGATALVLAAAGCAWFHEPPAEPGASAARPTTAPARPAATIPGAPPETLAAITRAPGGADSLAASMLPGSPPAITPPGAPADTAAAGRGLGAPPDTATARPEAAGTAALGTAAPETAAAPLEDVLSEKGRWVLDGRTLTGRTGPNGQVIEIDAPIITHGSLVVRARSGEYAADLSEARLRGGVTFRDGPTRGSCDTATYDRTTEILAGDGNVVVENDTLRMTADRARFDRPADVIHLLGRVVGVRGKRRMTANEAEWSRGRREVLLRGDVTVTEPGEETVLTGELILYDLESDRARVLESPRLELSAHDRNPIEITGERLWVEPGGDATVSGSVEVVRGGVTALSDSAAFFRAENRALLLGNPEVTERDGTLTGDTLSLFFDEDQSIRRVEMHGGARVQFAPQDSARIGEVSTVRGDSLVMFFAGGDADSVLVFGGAQSTYRPSPRDRSSGAGTNVVRGDSITIYLDAGRVDRVRVRGHAKGVFTFVERKGGKDSTAVAPAAPPDSSAAVDSLGTPRARAAPDTLAGPDEVEPGEDKVVYAGREVLYDLDSRTVDLLGSVDLDYGALHLTAGKVRFHADRRYLDAEDEPILVDRSAGGERKVVGKRMDYDLDTREGTIDGGRTKAEDGYIYAKRLRQVGDDDFIAKDGNFTTCDNVDHDKAPHFHFTSKRMRLYLKDKVVAKPVTLYIRDIPVLAIPFYVFSVRKGRQSGFLTPDFDFGLGGSSGRFFRNVGYYWAASQYFDLSLSATYYEGTPGRSGQFIGGLRSQYAKRYLMKGDVKFDRTLSSGSSGYDLVGVHEMTLGEWRVTGNGEFRDQQFRLSQPLGTDFGTRLDRILKSDASISRSFPFGASLFLSFRRVKDLDARPGDGRDETILTEDLPRYSFSLNSRPLGQLPDAEGKGGKLPGLASVRWTFSSSGNSLRTERERTTIVPIDTVTADTTYAILADRATQARHNLTVSDTRRIFGALNLNPSLRATEQWVDREFSAGDTVKAFRRAATWGASMGASTTLYGTFPGIGPVAAIRHTFRPSASFTYQPEFSSLTYTDTSGTRRPRFPGVSSSEARSVGLSMDHGFQAKVRSGEELKRVDLFHWTVGTAYDFVARDRGAHGWSPLSSNLDLSRIYGVSLNFTSAHDPYRRFRFQNYQLTGSYSLAGRLPGAEPRTAVDASAESAPEEEVPWSSLGADQSLGGGNRVGGGRQGGEDLAWNAGFSFSYGGFRQGEGLNTNASINFRGSVGITKNWSIDYNNRWDLVEAKTLGENLSLHRDLHCWEAQFTRSRLGSETTFSFRINVKDLPDVKYEQGRGAGTDFGSLTRVLP